MFIINSINAVITLVQKPLFHDNPSKMAPERLLMTTMKNKLCKRANGLHNTEIKYKNQCTLLFSLCISLSFYLDW